MKNLLFVVLFAFIIPGKMFSQFSVPIQPWAKELKNRILVVDLLEENPKEVKKFQKKDLNELKEYRLEIKEHNEKMKELIPKYWPFDNKIVFMKSSEIEALVKNGDERYAILEAKPAKEIRQSVKVYYTFSAYTLILYFPEYGKKVNNNIEVDDNGHGTSDFLKRGQYLFKVSMPDIFINDRDLKFALYQFGEFITRAETEGFPKKMSRYGFRSINFNPENSKLLKAKTLLIPQELLSIDEGEIPGQYRYSYRVLSLAEMDVLLENDIDNQYAYYTIAWTDKGRFWTLLIVDNETGKILAEVPTVDKKFVFTVYVPSFGNSLASLFSGPNINFVINEKHFEKLTEQINE
jgi:hypothetical protein